MNRLIPVINKLKNSILPLFLALLIYTGNAQEKDSITDKEQDSVTSVKKVKDSISKIEKVIDTVPSVKQISDTIPQINKALDTISRVKKVSDTIPQIKKITDSISPVKKVSDTIVKVEKTPKPIIIEENKIYVLGGISVTGIETVSEQSILVYSGLNAGQKIRIPGDKLSAAIKKLWNSKLFSNVEVFVTKIDGKSIYLEINVTELDKVGTLTVKGIKKSKLEEIKKEIEFKAGSMLTENLITTTKNHIENKYREKGYLKTKVTVSTKIDTSKTNTQNALILIDKGSKIKIDRITFHDNEALSDKKLKRLLKKTKEKSILKKGILSLFTGSKLVEDVYEEDLKKVVEKYQEKGYRDALIIKDSISWNDDNTINLDITVNEGEQYKFGKITFIGNAVFTDEQLQSMLKIDEGVIYNGKTLIERVKGDGSPDSNDITNLYYNRGYLFSSVDLVETSTENNIIDLEVRIIEDEQATFRKITIVGNDVTNDHVLFREVKTKPGQLFSKTDIVRTIRELGQLGYIDPEAIVPDVVPNHTDKTVDIEYSLAEKGSSQIELQGGFGGGTFIGTLGLSFNNFSVRNLFNLNEYKPVPRGDGQSVGLRLQVSRFSRTYSLNFSEPWMGGKKPRGFNFSIYNSRQFRYNFRTRRVDDSQRLDITGASIGLSQRLTWPDDFFTLSTSLNFQKFDLTNYFLPSFTFSNGASNNFNFAINFGRNSAGPNPVFPTTGSQFNLGLKVTPPFSSFNDKDYAAMDDEEKFKWLEYYKATFSGKWYTEVFGKLVLMSNAEFGFLKAYNNDIGAPPFERFYIGGDGLANGQFDGRQVVALRGYDNSTLSSRRGSTIYNKVSFEFRYPITLKPSASIYALAFMEGGNSWDDTKVYNPFKLKRSVGGGVRIFMPAFGLLGIDFGYGFDEVPGIPGEVSGWKTHFIIGQQF